MPKVDYSKLIETLGEDRIREVYSNNSIKKSCEILNIGPVKLTTIVSLLNLSHNSIDIRKATIQEDPNYYINRDKKIKQTKFEKYGDENYCNATQGVQTRESAYKSKDDYNKHYTETYLTTLSSKYGTWENYIKQHSEKVTMTAQNRTAEEHAAVGQHISEALKASLAINGKEVAQARFNTLIQKYGSWDAYISYMNSAIHNTCLERYGVDWAYMRPEAALTGNNSVPNIKFKELLIKNNLYESDLKNKEVAINKFRYDFKIDDTLIEIDPYFTHNSTFGIYNDLPKAPDYHQIKTRAAIDMGYRCIHIFDWDDPELILEQFKAKFIIAARKCEIKEITTKEAKEFITSNHLQGSCNGQKICIGLFYNNELIQIMTFGKPRYNKNYQYELLRLCTKLGIRVIGGSEKLFKYFIKTYNPNSIISYCDNAKFKGDVYIKLGFKLKTYGQPSKHWYNPKTQQHITDNLLRQRGFDQLFGTNYGKGTNNGELMLQTGFVEIYDCGQSVYTYNKEIV